MRTRKKNMVKFFEQENIFLNILLINYRNNLCKKAQPGTFKIKKNIFLLKKFFLNVLK